MMTRPFLIEEERKVKRTEREDYAMDLERVRNESDRLDLLGLTEKQMRCRGVSHCDVAEVFSPPRTAARARERGLKGGWSLDKDYVDPWTGKTWDLTDEKAKEAARRLVRSTNPKLLIASPPYTLFSMMQYLSGGPKDAARYEEACRMVEFAVELCEIQ